MTITRIVVASFFFLLSLVTAFAWLSSSYATSNFVLSDKIIAYSHEGALWYTRNADGGLIRAGPVEHGAIITTLVGDKFGPCAFKFTRHPPYTIIIVPYWAMLLVSLPLCLVFPWRCLRRRQRYGRCPNCNYDLRASPYRCPECGTPIARDGTAA